MIWKRHSFILIFIFYLTSSTAADVHNSGTMNPSNPFIHTEGKLLIDGSGKPLQLMGISFNNEAWNDFSQPQDKHNNQSDYQKIAGMGFNSVRLYLNYRWFEEDNKPYIYTKSWLQWLDQSIQWAKSSGIFVILTLCNPQGGIQGSDKGIETLEEP